MKHRLRWLVALAFGIVAGLLTGMLAPPTPTATVMFPRPQYGNDLKAESEDFIQGVVRGIGGPFTLEALSSDARFLVTSGKHKVQKFQAIHVWDRQAGTQKPMIEVPLDQPEFSGHTALFSPDEQTLAVVVWYRPKTRQDLVWFDLRSGAKIKGISLEMDHLFFAPDGRLLYVNGDVVRDLQSGEGLRKLEPTIDGFQRSESIGPFAVYRDEDRRVRAYSWLTGNLHASFTVQKEQGWLALPGDGQVLVSVAPNDAAGRKGFFTYELVEAGTGRSHQREAEFGGLSPDGQYAVTQEPPSRHPWLSKIWPVDALDYNFVVTHWRSDQELATFRTPQVFRFSPRSNQLAVLRRDLAIDVYDFPLSRPWAWIVGVALLTALAAWTIGWLWSRRHRPTPA